MADRERTSYYPPLADPERVRGALRAARTQRREAAAPGGRGVPGALEDIGRYVGRLGVGLGNSAYRAVMEDPWGTARGVASDLLTFPTTRELLSGIDGWDSAWRVPAAAGMAAMEAPGPVGALRMAARRSLRPMLTRSVAGQTAAFGPLMVAGHDPDLHRESEPFEYQSVPYLYPDDEHAQAFAPIPP